MVGYSRDGLYEGQIEMVDEVIWQQHTYVLERQPAFGFGIAVSGGVDNPAARTGDTSVIISDVVKGGPAWDKLQVNDILNNVNGIAMDNVSHSNAVAALKRSGKRVELTVKRKAVVKVPAPVRGGGRSTLGRSRGRSRSRSYDSRSRSYSRSRSRSRYSSRSRSRSYSDEYSEDDRYTDDQRSRGGRSRGGRSVDRRSTRSGRSGRSRHTSAHSRKSRSRPDLTDISPLSPDKPDEQNIDSSMMRLPVKAQEPERVILQKGKHSKESYGIRLGTRIFIQDVQPGSLADQKGLKRGDLVLDINGTGVDNKSVAESIQLISAGKGNKLQLVVQRQDGGTVTIPTAAMSRPNSRPNSRSPSRTYSQSERSSPVTKTAESPSAPPRSSNKPSHIPPDAVALPAMVSNSVAAPPPTKTAPMYDDYQPNPNITQPPPSDALQSSPVIQADEKPRQIVFMKAKNVGIRLAGGNDVGIFVASVQDGSPASQQGLRNGDQILEVNGQNYRQITREQAVIALMDLPFGSEVRVLAQYKPRHYESILERGTGDSFYIRTHFKYETNQQHELSFKKGKIQQNYL
jgi:C-terminal processing protease CtpA/Prc